MIFNKNKRCNLEFSRIWYHTVYKLRSNSVIIFSKRQKHCSKELNCVTVQNRRARYLHFEKNHYFLSGGQWHSESWGQRRFYLEVESGQARISCITDRCSQRYALVNLWLQLYLARTPLCLPCWTIFLFSCYYSYPPELEHQIHADTKEHLVPK